MGISFIVLSKTRFLHAVLLLLSCTAFYSCSEPSSPFGQTEITLTALDASCTEVWLELKFNNLTQPADVAIKKDGSEVARFLSVNKDTIFYIDGLLPSQNYSFEAVIRYEGRDDRTSNSSVVTTMDTTSHNFTWQTWEFGQHSSSVLYDVAIIDENNIWAVGEIYMKNSLGNPDPLVYNLIKWDGTSWKPERIYFINDQGQSFLAPMKSIIAFTADNIWIGLDQIIRWNGNDYQSVDIPNLIFHNWINKIWGTENNNIYIVGNSGTIAYYNGTSWQKIESGTNLNINDIWGDYNKITREWEILAVAGNILNGSQKEREVLEIKNGNKVIHLNGDGINWPLSGVWFQSNKRHYVTGSGIYYKNLIGDSVWNSKLTSISPYHANRIKGDDANDVVIVGAYGEVLHFNGVTWQSNINKTGLTNGSYYGVDIKNNLIVNVGTNMSKAIITVGKR